MTPTPELPCSHRSKVLALVFALVLGLLAIAAVTQLQARSSASRDSELSLAVVKSDLLDLQVAPFRANASTGGSPKHARGIIASREGDLKRRLGELRNGAPEELADLTSVLRSNFAILHQVYVEGSAGPTYDDNAANLATVAGYSFAQADGLLAKAGQEYHQRAARSDRQATIGSAATILLLLAAFAFFFRRSERLARENRGLLAASREEALTDALTGLPNRRSLLIDLEARLAGATGDEPVLLALFDLDGFKQYNDTFGHPAGDALLNRLGGRLANAVEGRGTAYRMGGDEFCVVASVDDDAAQTAARAADALSDSGEHFRIGCSYGTAVVPADATTPLEALILADQRMYSEKASRASASRQTTDVLLQVLNERDDDLASHVSGVADLAERVARALGLGDHESERIRLAAELHDVGKCAIPEAVLNKPGPLDEDEWAFMRTHTLIGERIVLAAPSLTHTAALIRSSHERFDGTGYPDALSGDEIPLGARIIAVCDAFEAMTAQRSYSAAMPVNLALEELEQCAGRQFDASVVAAFATVLAEAGSHELIGVAHSS